MKTLKIPVKISPMVKEIVSEKKNFCKIPHKVKKELLKTFFEFFRKNRKQRVQKIYFPTLRPLNANSKNIEEKLWDEFKFQS